uniref:Uncharacterized protein n=1 Tax=Lepeophtheirus salmonis TaxID=72036 RepID=A0A0K2T7D6_LEPSM
MGSKAKLSNEIISSLEQDSKEDKSEVNYLFEQDLRVDEL